MNRELRGKEDWNIVGCLEKLSEKFIQKLFCFFQRICFPHID